MSVLYNQDFLSNFTVVMVAHFKTRKVWILNEKHWQLPNTYFTLYLTYCSQHSHSFILSGPHPADPRRPIRGWHARGPARARRPPPPVRARRRRRRRRAGGALGPRPRRPRLALNATSTRTDCLLYKMYIKPQKNTVKNDCVYANCNSWRANLKI